MEYIVVSLTNILNFPNVNFEKIESAMKNFSCSKEKDLEKFLLGNSFNYERGDIGKTYFILDKEAMVKNAELKIMAFFTVALTTLNLSTISNKRKKKIIGNYPGRDALTELPAYLIGQLGRNDAYSSSELSGSEIMNECANILTKCKNMIGGKIVILECKEDLQKVYISYNFEKFSDINDKGLYTYYKRIDEFNIQ